MTQLVGHPTWQSFADFLANAPPGNEYEGQDAFEYSDPLQAHHISQPIIRFYCDAECRSVMNFESIRSDSVKGGFQRFITYTCKHCDQYAVFFALMGACGKDGVGHIAKIGQYPPFGPSLPAKLQRLIQPDREMFLQGYRAETMNLGVGAFAYYRRVVEKQKDRLFSEMIKVAKGLNYSEDDIATLEKAKGNWSFQQSVANFKDAIPDAFKIHGHNPLTLLHNALSEGVHALSDTECLQRAQDARTVLVALAERLSALSAEQKELNDSVARLVIKKKSNSTSK